jgi:hypothetical protein
MLPIPQSTFQRIAPDLPLIINVFYYAMESTRIIRLI